MVTKICVGDYVGDIYQHAEIGLGVSVLRMRDFAPIGTKRLGYFWGDGVLEKGYRRDARTDFDAEYVKRRGSAQGSAFCGWRNQYLKFGPPFFQNRHFWPHFRFRRD